MPSQSSAFPYASDVYSNTTNLTVQAPSTRHRSGSVTLPSDRADGVFGTTLFSSAFSSYEASSPIDENTIASTLASLGLDDENTQQRSSAPMSTSSNVDQYLHPGSTRSRSYTVASQMPEHPEISRLQGMPFSPFSPQTRNSVMQRPRAISLGMADGTPSMTMPNAFSPFEMGSLHRLQPQINQIHHLQQQQPQQQPVSADRRPLRNSRSSGNLVDLSGDGYRPFGRAGSHDQLSSLQELNAKDFYNSPLAGDTSNNMPSGASSASHESPSSAPAQMPSRALWLGNINPSLSVPDLMLLFSGYGTVESARILSDKECAFVNFTTMESAVAAKNDLETRLGSKLAGTPVRVGFGKADVNLAMALTNEAGPNAQGPTRALWIGNIPANMNPAVLRTLFQPFGAIESVRVLSHKNCGFVNFEHQEDAVRARKTLQNKEILGPGTGSVRIGFAKVPSNNPEENDEATLQQPASTPDTYQATQWATAMMMTSMMMNASGQQQTTQPSLYTAIGAERQFIMQQLGHSMSDSSQIDRVPLSYCSVIPSVPELSSDRILEPLRLREMRKRLESGQALQDVESIAAECMDEIVELCSDYIGNTVVQKLFEYCDESTKQMMLEKIAPYLAAIGVHKNGTWAAQKIVDFANTPAQIQLIHKHIAPYVPLLLLDQFGNYVVQCCLRMGPAHNQYIFDAIVDKCWEIGQGRFGARAVRAILENSIVTEEQQCYVAAAIVQNAVLLTTNVNGTLLLIWFLDTSELPGRFRVLCPRLLPYLGKLCTHKLGSMTVFKVINQQQEPDASSLLVNAIFGEASLLDDVLKDQVHGVALIQKITTIAHLERREYIVKQIKESLTQRLKVQNIQSYKKILEDLEIQPAEENPRSETATSSPHASNDEAASSDSTGNLSWMQNPQAVAMMANMYAAAMTAAAATIQPQQQTAATVVPSSKISDLPQFDRLLKTLLKTPKEQDEEDTL
ncbi:hypothetical protein DFQ28_006884 [Apophysomyces sp. BC1034]|nr:hypothetical protein DFQ30_000023 [Apophysomyces sp. BC1015]KAG0181983.1 hypothetical protein DFQ29_006242 [Apophysomyces sp. BC1021]KAG0193000.1 hypothetical protein DFQ28_006884 [Apophysomyces sp. BC1034]